MRQSDPARAERREWVELDIGSFLGVIALPIQAWDFQNVSYGGYPSAGADRTLIRWPKTTESLNLTCWSANYCQYRSLHGFQ